MKICPKCQQSNMNVLLINYDNQSHINWFPTGLAYMARILEHQGHDVRVYDNAVTHRPYSRLTEHLDSLKYDFVGLGACGGYYQYRQAKEIIDAITKSRNRPNFRVVVGGPLFSPDPDYFLDKWDVDHVVKGEGERVAECLRKVCEEGGRKTVLEGAPVENLDDIPFPAYHYFDLNHYCLFRFHAHMQRSDRAMPVISSRGCKFNCNFCYRMVGGQRLRTPGNVVDEIRVLQMAYDINYISFADELFMASEERAVEMAEALAPLNIRWDCMGRLNFAKPDVLGAMKRAGCTFINYGIEQFDNSALKAMNKALNEEVIVKGVEATLRAGISPGLNIIWGNLGDTERSLEKSVNFLLKYDDQVQLRTIRPVTPYPGSPLYYEAIKRGLIKDIEDFYENKHVNSDLLTCNFTPYSDKGYYEILGEANKCLVDNYYDKLKEQMHETIDDLYKNRNKNFRGYRAI